MKHPHMENIFTCCVSNATARPSDTSHSIELNFEDGDSPQNLKVRVSSLWM